MDEREQLRQRFNSNFANWEIELPADALQLGVVWLIVQGGWTIWTRLDAEGGREHLDYYAMHRMTNDRHTRLFANGEEDDLPAIEGMYGVPKDATPEEEAAVRAEHFERNQEVEKLLDEKGFFMTDKAHGSAIVSRYLQTNPEAGDDL